MVWCLERLGFARYSAVRGDRFLIHFDVTDSSTECCDWEARAPTEVCPTECGHSADTLRGEVVCVESGDGAIADESDCVAVAEPAIPTQECEATGLCGTFFVRKA